MGMGYLLLLLGVGAYIRLALFGQGTVLFSFVCCMACLLFFNLPPLVTRLRSQGEDEE